MLLIRMAFHFQSFQNALEFRIKQFENVCENQILVGQHETWLSDSWAQLFKLQYCQYYCGLDIFHPTDYNKKWHCVGNGPILSLEISLDLIYTICRICRKK